MPGTSAGAYLYWKYDYSQFTEFQQAYSQVLTHGGVWKAPENVEKLVEFFKGTLTGNENFKQKVNNAVAKFKQFKFYVTYAFEIEIEESQIGGQFGEYGQEEGGSDSDPGFVEDLLLGQGMFGDEGDTSGTKYDPFIDADIYELLEKDATKWDEETPLTTPSGATHYINFNPKSTKKIPLNLYPSLKDGSVVTVSNTNVLLPRLQHVVVTKEWVTGDPSFAEVELLNGAKGYIPSSLLYPVASIKSKILDKSIVKPGPSKSVMAQALVPPWQKNTKPYFFSERSEWWVNTTLPYTCVVNEEDLQNKKLEAIPIAIQKLMDYRNKGGFSALFDGLTAQKIANGFLGATADDVYLSTRPGSRLKVLVKIPSVYLKAVPASDLGYNPKTDQTEFDSDHDPDGINIKIEELESSLRNALKAMVKFNQEYSMSEYHVQGFSFPKEIKRLASIPSLIKGLLKDNDLSYSDLIAQGPNDPCSNIGNSINTLDFGFSIDETPKDESNCPEADKIVKLKTVVYNSKGIQSEDSEDTFKRVLLLRGFNDILNSKIFSSPRTTALFLYHQNFNDPGLDWRTFIEKYCYDCKPKIMPRGNSYTESRSPQNNSSCAGESKNDPNRMFSIPQISFEDLFKKVAGSLNKSLDLDENSQITPNLDLEFDMNFNLDFKSNMISQRNSMSSFTGDWFSSINGLSDIEFNIATGGLDSLFNYVLKHVDFGKLFGSLGSYYASGDGLSDDSGGGGFGGFDGFGGGTGNIGGASSGFEFGEFNGGDISNVGIDGSFDFALEIPSFNMRLPTINLLESLNDFLMKALEAILVGILLALIIYLLRSLIEKEKAESCGAPEGQDNPPNAFGSAISALSYGKQNLNDMLSDSIGVYDEDIYEDRMLGLFMACGVPISDGSQVGVPKDQPKKFMDDVSSMISSKEMLLLMQGNCPDDVLGEVQFLILDSYPNIGQYLNNLSKIEDFFLCFGGSMSSKVIEAISEDISNVYKNPEVCFDIKKEIEKAMEERCPIASFRNNIFEKELADPINTYKKIITILSQKRGEIFDGANIFDCEDGTPGLLSQQKPENLDYVISKTTDTLFGGAKNQLDSALINYFDNLMAFKSPLGSENTIRNMNDPQFLASNATLDGMKVQYPLLIASGYFDNSNKIGGDFKSRFNNFLVEKQGSSAYTVGTKDNNGDPLLYTQGADGTSYLVPYIADKQVLLQADPFYPLGNLPPDIDNMINNYKPTVSSISLNEKVLGSMFAAQLSTFTTNTSDIMSNFSDVYAHICKSTIEAIGSKISNNEGANQSSSKVRELPAFYKALPSAGDYIPNNKKIQDYSNNLAKKVSTSEDYKYDYLIPFHEAKEIIKNNINYSKYDDPTNPATIGPTQEAYLMGVLNVLGDVYATDLILQSIFSFLVYQYDKMENRPFIGQYILTKMESDIAPELLSVLKSASYNVLLGEIRSLPGGKEGNDDLVQKYLSSNKSLLYYIEKSVKSQAKRVRQRMPSEVKTSLLPFSDLIWSTKLNPVQVYEQSSVEPVWVEESNLWSEDLSSEFENGKFFLEYYVRVYEYEQGDANYNDLWANRDITKKGILNPAELKSYLTNLVDTDEITQVYGFSSSQLKLSNLFKEVEYGVRLSYGFIVKETTPDPLKTFAKSIKDLYNSSSDAKTSSQLSKAYFIEHPDDKDQYIIPLFSSTESYEDILIEDFDINVQLTDPGNQKVASEQSIEAPSYNKLLKILLASEMYNSLINVGVPIHEFVHICILYNMQIISNPNNTGAANVFAGIKSTMTKNIELILNAKKYDYEP